MRGMTGMQEHVFKFSCGVSTTTIPLTFVDTLAVSPVGEASTHHGFCGQLCMAQTTRHSADVVSNSGIHHGESDEGSCKESGAKAGVPLHGVHRSFSGWLAKWTSSTTTSTCGSP